MGVTTKLALRIATATLLMSGSSAALAQASASGNGPATPSDQAGPKSSGGLSEIVVTATRRSTNVQSVPFAISAVSGDALRNKGITTPTQLSGLAPSLNVDQGLGNGETHVSIRGLASTDYSLGASSPVATYIDDVYQPYQYGLGTQIFDLDRIEVLRGPQGTLFGKNTTGGALLYYSQAPTSREEGYLNLDGGAGQFRHYSAEGAFNKPLGDTLAARFSFRVDKRDDYIDNLYNGSRLGHYNNYNARLQLAWKPTSSTRVNLKLFGLKQNGDGPSYIGKYYANPCDYGDPYTTYFKCDASGNPAPASPNPNHTYDEAPIYEKFDNYGVTLKIDQDVSGFTVTSISNAQEGHYSVGTNDDGTAADFFHSRQMSKTWQTSEELRLATPADKPLKAVVGLYGQYDHISAEQGSASTRADPLYSYIIAANGFQSTTTLAAFTNVNWEINKAFTLVGGLRYSSEHKKILDPFYQSGFAGDRVFNDDDIFYNNVIGLYDPTLGDINQVFSDHHTWRKLTWDATANIKPAEGKLIYLKASSGFRSGGYVVGVTVPDSFLRLKPETVRSYEAGFKTEWLDRHLRVNGAAYWSDYKDQQVQVPNPDGAGLYVNNAGKSRIKGAELEVTVVPVNHLEISGSVGYTDAKYRQYATSINGLPTSYAGNLLPYAPKWTGSAGVSYTVDLGDRSLEFNTDWSIRSRIYFAPDNRIESSDTSRAIGNLRVSYGDKGKGWRLSLYANNITNQYAKAFGFTTLTPDNEHVLLQSAIYAPGRTWGVQAGFKF